MWCFAIRRPSRVAKGSRPVKCAIVSAAKASGNSGARGSLTRGGLRPTKAAISASICAERDIVAAEDIALADPPRCQRRQMARRDIVDMDEIEAGVDIGRHASARRLDENAPGRRRPRIARADRRRGIDDDRRKALPRPSLRRAARRRSCCAYRRRSRCSRRGRRSRRPPRRRAAPRSRRCSYRRCASTPACAAACMTLRVPSTLAVMISPGSRAQSR